MKADAEPIIDAGSRGGWVKLPRRLLSDAVFADAGLFQLYVYLMLSAAFRPTIWPAKTGGGTRLVKLDVGQAIVGRETTAAALGIPESTYRRRLKVLADFSYITLKADTHFSIVTLCDLPDCDDTESQSDHPASHAASRAVDRPEDTPRATLRTTSEERKKKGTEEEKNDGSLFERFWNEFPRGRRTKKGDARKAWKTAIKRADPEVIIAAATEYTASPTGQGRYVLGPEPWLNGDCWEDDREAWQRGDDEQEVQVVGRLPTAEEDANWSPVT